MSIYYYRLRSPKGLDNTLIKELKWHFNLKNDCIRKV